MEPYGAGDGVGIALLLRLLFAGSLLLGLLLVWLALLAMFAALAGASWSLVLVAARAMELLRPMKRQAGAMAGSGGRLGCRRCLEVADDQRKTRRRL